MVGVARWAGWCLVVLAGCGGPRVASREARASSHAPTENQAATTLPRTPSRSDIMSAMSALSDAVDACGRGRRDQVQVIFVFESSGTVTEARVASQYSYGSREPGPGCGPREGEFYSCTRERPADPEVDTCVLEVARRARVTPFSSPTFRVEFPFRISGD
jgi:hypothetical protein